jgi:hypothetical protein
LFDLAHDRAKRRISAAGHHYLGAFLRELQRAGPANAGAAAGDQGYFS